MLNNFHTFAVMFYCDCPKMAKKPLVNSLSPPELSRDTRVEGRMIFVRFYLIIKESVHNINN